MIGSVSKRTVLDIARIIFQASSLPCSYTTSSARSPYYLATGTAVFAKRPSRPFPPPFQSAHSNSFSDPLSPHHHAQWRGNDVAATGRRYLLRGLTNGDDAVYASPYFIGVNDGVGAWSTRKDGHAGLWSRLILHYWAQEVEQCVSLQDRRKDASPLADEKTQPASIDRPEPIEFLQRAFEATIEACTKPNPWQGTTTVAGAQLFCPDDRAAPILYITNLGDSQILVIRPDERQVLFKTTEQWHWFDCPRQLGTNSPDTPKANAVLDRVEIREHDVVLAMSDGVTDNLWEYEILTAVVEGLHAWNSKDHDIVVDQQNSETGVAQSAKMKFIAEKIMKAARTIATDPFAESPYMERNIEEGLAMEGGKLDDISVVAGECRRRPG